MELTSTLCDNLAKILGGKSKFENGICTVSIDRHDVKASIANKPYRSLEHMFHFESPDGEGNYLITGELVLLENEVQKFLIGLTNAGITVGAVHNHWLFDEPRLIYIHIETIASPLTFAARMAQIIKG